MMMSRFNFKLLRFFNLKSCEFLKFQTWTTKLKLHDAKNFRSFSNLKLLFRPLNILALLNVNRRRLSNNVKFCRHWYYDSTTKKLITVVFKRCQPGRPICTFAAAAYSFSWEENGISNQEIQSYVDELSLLHQQSLINKDELPQVSELKNLPQYWENLLDEPNIKIWKMRYKNTDFAQYKVFGRFTDISAKQFYTVQKNVEFRRKWDDLVMDIKVIDENAQSNEQVIQWIARFPYPFNPREYVYIRKTKVDKENNLFVLMNRSVEHPKCVTHKKHVRVPLYVSDMVIKPHRSADDPGLDYLLTYCDNPQTNLPTQFCNWVVSVGIPDFIGKVHKAASQVDNYSDKHNSDDVSALSFRTHPRPTVGAF